MYQVYSMQQPGRPRWALAASTLLLAGAVGLAAALVHTKHDALVVTLDAQSQSFPAAQLRLRLPANWESIQEGIEELPGAVVMARSGLQTGEAIIVFRPPPRPFATPSEDGAEALRLILRPLDPGEELRSEPASVAGLPGWGVLFGSRLEAGRRPLLHLLARVGIAPGGQIVAVVLRLPRDPLAEDHLLMDDLCASIELTDLQVTGEATRLAEDTGIQFSPRGSARFVSSTRLTTANLPRLRMFGGEGMARWFMEVSRVPLIEGQGPAGIVEMYATSTSHTATAPAITEETTQAGRALARVVLPPQRDRLPRLLVACAGVDQHTGLLIVGWSEDQGERQLHELAMAVADTAQVRASEDLVQPSAAKSKAREILETISKDGLTPLWQGLGDKQQTFAEWAPLRTGARMLTSCVREKSTDASTWWTITSEYLVPLNPLPGINVDSAFARATEKWSLPDDGSAHAGRIIMNTNLTGGLAYEYTELRRPGENLVRCELTSETGETQDWEVAAQESYICDPLLLAASAILSKEPPGQAALFTTSEPFNRHAPWVILTAMGEVKLPNPTKDERALAVRLIKDYDPDPIILYHARTGELLAVGYDDGFWHERAELGPTPARIRSFRARP